MGQNRLAPLLLSNPSRNRSTVGVFPILRIDRPPQLTWPRETRSKHEKALAASATPGSEYWLP